MTPAASLAALAFLALASGPAAVAPAHPVAPEQPSVETNFGGKVPSALQWRLSPGDTDHPGSIEFGMGYESQEHSFWMSHVVIPVTARMVGVKPSDLMSHIHDAPVSELQLSGIEPDALIHAQGPVSFTVHRDAADFRCDGSVRDGQGGGSCVYTANPDFAAGLKARGVRGELAPFPQFELALGDLGYEYLDELKREAYATPDVTTLVRAGEHGAGLRQLRAMDAAGYRFGDVESLIRVRDHGVSAKFVGELDGYGLKHVPAEELVELRDHGVGGTFLKGLTEAGYTGMSPQDLTKLRDHGVSTGFITELKSEGYVHVAAEDLIRMRDHGVSTGFIRRANQDGGRKSPDELIRMRDGGER